MSLPLKDVKNIFQRPAPESGMAVGLRIFQELDQFLVGRYRDIVPVIVTTGQGRDTMT